jgi:germination protein M
MIKNKNNKNSKQVEEKKTVMPRSLKIILIAVIILVVLTCVSIVVAVIVNENKLGAENIRTKLYYINNGTHTVDYELRSIAKSEDKDKQLGIVSQELLQGSKSANQTLEIPSEVQIQSMDLDGSTLTLDLSKSFNDLTQDKKIMSLAALVYTFTETEFVTDVTITVDGSDIAPRSDFNRESVRLNPSIDPEKTNWQMVKLYFVDASGEKLVAEERSIEVKQSLTLEYQIVDQLLAGPEDSSFKSTIPAETKIKDIKTEDGICYVNLSGEFINKNAGSEQSTALMVYSIVNSLTELENVNRVQFLIEGEKVEGIHSNFDFSKPFDRNQQILE